jgi:glycosyltransferase involved in cell wall biosynthesis
MKVSVVIPTLNRPEPLIGTLVSLLNQTWDDYEIIVVDQSPEPNHEVEAMLLTAPRNVRYFRIDSIGSPAARNYGIEWATGDVVLSCDDDIIAHPTLIECHAKNYEDESIGGVAGRVLLPHDTPLTKKSRVGRFNRWTGCLTAHFNAHVRTEVDHVLGANASFRRDVLQRVGGFDPAFSGTGFFEEADLSLRIKAAGYRLVFDPTAVVQHLQFGSGGNRVSRREHIYWQFHNRVLLFRRHMPRGAAPIYAMTQIARAIGYALRERDPRLFDIALRGWAEGLLHFPRNCVRNKGRKTLCTPSQR